MAIHFAEIVNHDESHYIIKTLKPGRIGHGTCVDEELEEEMVSSLIPLGVSHQLASLYLPAHVSLTSLFPHILLSVSKLGCIFLLVTRR